MTLPRKHDSAFSRLPLSVCGAALAVGLLALAGCQSSGGASAFSETTQHGYVVTPEALAQVPVGSSRDQVLIALGSPSTTGEYGGEVFYYISQTRFRAVAFMPDKVVDQHVVAIYFDAKNQVSKVANYGLKDGKRSEEHTSELQSQR